MQQQIILNGIPPEDFWETIRGIVQAALSQIHKPEKVKPFLSLTEASEFTHLSKSTLYRLTSQQQIPHIKRGGKLLFNREQITQWLEDASQPSRY
jgi:excisionase family DNA binding protein